MPAYVHQRSRVLIVVAVAAATLLMVGYATLATGSPRATVALGVLERPPVPFPAQAFGGLAERVELDVDTRATRLAAADDQRRVFVAPSSDGRSVCLLVEAADAVNGGATCNPLTRLRDNVIFVALPVPGETDAEGNAVIVGLVNDGVRTVTPAGHGPADVNGNVFVSVGPRYPATFTLTGDAGTYDVPGPGTGAEPVEGVSEEATR